jgi:coenzyme F420-dependent glucose-6-phosphate dehydrogenase
MPALFPEPARSNGFAARRRRIPLLDAGRPRKAGSVIAAYRRGAEAAGRPPGEIILQTLASWGEGDDAALESAREWKGTLVDEHYTDPIADPAEIGRNGEEISDKQFKAMAILAEDPETHVKKLRMLERLGATTVCVMNVCGSDPEGLIRMYGERVLPELRDQDEPDVSTATSGEAVTFQTGKE